MISVFVGITLCRRIDDDVDIDHADPETAANENDAKAFVCWKGLGEAKDKNRPCEIVRERRDDSKDIFLDDILCS